MSQMDNTTRHNESIEPNESIEQIDDTKKNVINGIMDSNNNNNCNKNRYCDELGFYRSTSHKTDDVMQLRLSAIRDLGISHFDKTINYDAWKQDWDVFIKNKLIRNEPISLNRALKMRLRTGIPQDYRRKVWTAMINMRVRHIRERAGPNAYQNYLAKSSTGSIHARQQKSIRSDQTNVPTSELRVESSSSNGCGGDKYLKQIELDLLRTLPNNKHFDKRDSIGVNRVRRVLKAYSVFNPRVGYCQGMNRLAAVAMLILPEEDAFWCLVAIIECIMPTDYYFKPYLAQVDCRVLSDFVSKKMPKLHRHLVSREVELTPFTWFFTIFVDGFRPEIMLRIWDCFLLEGDKVLFRFALSIIYMAQERLLQMNDFASINGYLNSISSLDMDVEYLFHTFNTLNPMSAKSIEEKRKFYLPIVQKGFEAP